MLFPFSPPLHLDMPLLPARASLKPDIRLLQSSSNLEFQNPDHLPFGCLCWLKACISMGEKMLEWISRRPSPVYLLQAKIECVFQSVQYSVSSNNVKAKGCGREPLTTACLLTQKEKLKLLKFSFMTSSSLSNEESQHIHILRKTYL